MKSLTNRINESVVIKESNEMNFDDVLLELQIMGFSVKETSPNKKYTAKKKSEYDINISRGSGDNITITTSRDSHKEKTEYTYTEFMDDVAVNSL